jgi:hypothetical protein
VSPLARAADGAVGALDGGRRWLWRQVVRTSAGRTCARDRSTRILALGLGHIAVACALVALGPAYLLLLGPLVLGGPHVIADVRYLVVRGPASLRPETVIAFAAPLALIAGLRLVEVLGGPSDPMVEVCLGCATIAIGVTLAPGNFRRRAWILAGLIVLAIPAIAAPYEAMIVLLHGHNVVALVIWLCWTRRTVRFAHRLAIAAATLAVTLALLGGALDGLAQSDGVAAFGPALAPGLEPELAYRVVLAYVFLQAMHYVFWLRLIPSTQSHMPAASTFRKSITSLRTDFGTIGLAVLALATLSVPLAAGMFDAARVRDVYLSVAVFHAWLELGVIGYVLVSRERLDQQVEGQAPGTAA